ncbi:MAG: DUF4114 domain-containing protein [Colwellia sp.]|nr:DUF4114 domain-containing protein [Colwellia sp.]
MSNAIKPVIGTSADDVITTGVGSQVIIAGGGDDIAHSGSGTDEIIGGSGNDLLFGESGDDVLWGGGGPKYIKLNQLEINTDYEGRIVFEGESAGYKNTLGSYKIDENGDITDVVFHFINASSNGSGGTLTPGVSTSNLSLTAGEQVGFFIVANGYSVNNSYQGLDFNTGQLVFRDSQGNIANIEDSNPTLWFVAQDGSETQIQTNKYHSADGQISDYNLNPDGISHIVGLMSPSDGYIRLGFEDLYNGGDLDFDDCVFTAYIGTSNTVLPASPPSSGGVVEDDDELHGGSGNDQLHGRAGDDLLYGENGSDYIYGGAGKDVAYGGSGSDYIEGGSGDDSLFGGNGHDEIIGGSGNDTIYGDSGNDQLTGNSGNDTIFGGTGADIIEGGGGDDVIYGGSSQDTINGGSGADTIDGGSASDSINGGSGADIIDGGSGHDTIIGGSGEDIIDGGSGSDTIMGGTGADILYGGSGSDIITGGSGNDYINGGSGRDNLHGGSGNDTFISGSGKDTVNGSSGIDTVSYAQTNSGVYIDLHNKRSTGGDSDTLISIENAIGSDFADILKGSGGDNELVGGAGNDLIRGARGDDTLTGGLGEDTFTWRESDLSGYLDTITDFDASDDILQFTLTEDLSLSNVSDWLNLVEVDGNTIVQIDLDGTGGNYGFSDFVVLENIDNLSLLQLNIDPIA